MGVSKGLFRSIDVYNICKGEFFFWGGSTNKIAIEKFIVEVDVRIAILFFQKNL